MTGLQSTHDSRAAPAALLASQVLAAERAEAACNEGGFFMPEPLPAWQCEAVSEAAAERAAIEAEASATGAVLGLVSVPTSGQNASAYRTSQRGLALRAALKATETDKHKARISRMRRSVGFSARAVYATSHEPGRRHGYVAMVTLTYADSDGWEARHISDALKQARRWHAERGVSMRYVWVAELQKRGALHYHLAFWMPHGVVMPKWDLEGWWPHGYSRGETARDAVSYLMKYLSKGTDTTKFPKGARMHGSGGVEHALRRAKRWLGYPSWVKARADIHDDWRPAVGGGWADPEGHVIPSEHTRAWLGDRWGALRVADYGRPFPADGPFTWLHRGFQGE